MTMTSCYENDSLAPGVTVTMPGKRLMKCSSNDVNRYIVLYIQRAPCSYKFVDPRIIRTPTASGSYIPGNKAVFVCFR